MECEDTRQAYKKQIGLGNKKKKYKVFIASPLCPDPEQSIPCCWTHFEHFEERDMKFIRVILSVSQMPAAEIKLDLLWPGIEIPAEKYLLTSFACNMTTIVSWKG